MFLFYILYSHSGKKVIFLAYFFIILFFCPKVFTASLMPINQRPFLWPGSKISIQSTFLPYFSFMYIYVYSYYISLHSHLDKPSPAPIKAWTAYSSQKSPKSLLIQLLLLKPSSIPTTLRTKNKHLIKIPITFVSHVLH